MMSRRYVAGAALVFALISAACGSGGITPTAPVTPTPVTPTPPPPSYPAMTGNWTGTAVIVAVVGASTGSNTCALTWTIPTQTAGAFSGTFQLSGGTVTPCAGAGAVTGTIGTDGTLGSLAIDTTVGAPLPPSCVKTGTTPYSGLLSNGLLRATSTEQLVCSGQSASRNSTVSLSKQ